MSREKFEIFYSELRAQSLECGFGVPARRAGTVLRKSLPPKGEAIATKKRLCSEEHRRFAQLYKSNHPGRVTPESASIF